MVYGILDDKSEHVMHERKQLFSEEKFKFSTTLDLIIIQITYIAPYMLTYLLPSKYHALCIK